MFKHRHKWERVWTNGLREIFRCKNRKCAEIGYGLPAPRGFVYP